MSTGEIRQSLGAVWKWEWFHDGRRWVPRLVRVPSFRSVDRRMIEAQVNLKGVLSKQVVKPDPPCLFREKTVYYKDQSCTHLLLVLA
jgi:hypothetical protein